MSGADYVPYLSGCPRCGERGLERLRTHQHCINCNYSDQEPGDAPKGISVPDWAIEAFRQGKKVTFYKGSKVPVIEEYEPVDDKGVLCA